MFPVGKMWISLGSIQENTITLKSIYQTKYSVSYSEKIMVKYKVKNENVLNN